MVKHLNAVLMIPNSDSVVLLIQAKLAAWRHRKLLFHLYELTVFLFYCMLKIVGPTDACTNNSNYNTTFSPKIFREVYIIVTGLAHLNANYSQNIHSYFV